ncbi:carbon-nitrogen hydrolase [bacterium]|nr:carbon-nitrogen hydrolase [bacterium]
MKISAVQFAPALDNLAKTIEDLEALFNQCRDSEMVILPELSNSGYNFSSREEAWESSEPIDQSRFLMFLQEKSAKSGSTIVSGFNERDGKSLFNSAVVITDGKILGKYQKLHLFYREKEFFKVGTTGLPVFEIGDIKIGVQICFDWMFPEAWRVLALKGADIICHPANLVLPGLAQSAVPTHALINRVFTITANRVGTEGNLTFTGASTIASPRGQVLSQASASESEVLTVEIDPTLGRNKFITPLNHIFDDRKPEEYQLLVEEDFLNIEDYSD